MTVWNLSLMNDRERECAAFWFDALMDNDTDTARYWADQGLAAKEDRQYEGR